jgi:hypothetical protein
MGVNTFFGILPSGKLEGIATPAQKPLAAVFIEKMFLLRQSCDGARGYSSMFQYKIHY